MNPYRAWITLGVVLLLAIIAGATIFFWDEIRSSPYDLFLAVYASLVEDVIFFGTIGLTIFLYQSSDWRGESVRKRVERVFANKSVSVPAVQHIEDIVRKNSVYAVKASHKLTVLEYNRDLRAYRVEFHNTYVLRNLFGDLKYDFPIAATVAPDLIMDKLPSLGEIISISVERAGEKENILSGPTPLPAEGFAHPLHLRLEPSEEITFDMEWWSWATNVGNSGFSIRRFSERTIVEVENKSNVTVRVFRPEAEDEIIDIAYRDKICIREQTNVHALTRLDFSWLPPAEFDSERSTVTDGAGLSPLLERPDKI